VHGDQLPSIANAVERLFVEFNTQTTTATILAAARADADFIPLAKEIISMRTRDGRLSDLALSDLTTDFDRFKESVNEPDRRVVLATVANHPAFWTDIEAELLTPAVREVLASLAFAGNIVVLPDTRDKAVEVLKGKLVKLDRSEWVEALRNETYPLTLSLQLAAASPHPFQKGGNTLFNVLMELSAELSEGAPLDLTRRWFNAADLLSASSRRTLLKKLRERMVDSPTNALLNLIGVGGDSFFADGGFSDDGDASLRNIVVPLVDDYSNVVVLQAHLKALESWVAGASNDTLEVIKDKLHQVRETASGDQRNVIDKLISIFSPTARVSA
jgi:hypothetical protein